MVRSLRTLVAVVVACGIGAGCGSDSVAAPLTMASIAGTYNLKSYNGITVPAVIQASGPKVEVLNDQVIVNANGTWSESGTYRISDLSGVTTQTETGAGTYTLNGATVTFRESTDGSVITGVFAGVTFTVANVGATLIYSR